MQRWFQSIFLLLFAFVLLSGCKSKQQPEFLLRASLWANVDRKRKELSVLRLVGFRTGDIIWFPDAQSFFTAVLGWVLAGAIYLVAAWGINDMLAPQLQVGQEVCRLLPEHYGVALLLTAGSAILSAALAGFKSARIEPSEGLREV